MSGDDSLGAENEGTLLDGGWIDAPRGDAAETASGLRHLAVACAVLLVCVALPYGIADATWLQIWTPDEGVPIARMFTGREPPPDGMEVVTGYVGGRDRDTVAQLADPVIPAEETAAAAEATDANAPAEPAVRIAREEYADLPQEIEDPSNALEPFYRQLLRTADDEPRALTRVAHYGDSSIAGDGITMTLRRNFQRRFGDGGHGFILVASGTMPYRHQDIRTRANAAWQTHQLVRSEATSGFYGYGGVQFRAVAGAEATFETSDRGPVGHAVSRFELFYLEHDRGPRVQLRVDRGDWQDVETRGEDAVDRWHTVEVPDGDHRLDLRVAGGGVAKLYGVVLERAGPGVVYDSLGMVGARGNRLLRFDAAHFRRQHQHRETNLFVLGFGGNEADDVHRSGEDFERDVRRVIRFVRQARPEAGCLWMGPLDQAARNARGRVETMPQVPVIVEAQRRGALAEGCAYFDTFAAMGGEGAMRRWSRARPRLAFGDYRHATPAGYQAIGNMVYRALLKGFADWLAAGHGAN
jgi:lysophospholipase L1-like esterase